MYIFSDTLLVLYPGGFVLGGLTYLLTLIVVERDVQRIKILSSYEPVPERVLKTVDNMRQKEGNIVSDQRMPEEDFLDTVTIQI